MSDGFELLCSVKANDLIPVEKYRSKSTGFTVIIAQVEGPLVNGYFCLATEAHDDDGLPHTLEHLVFMGSEKYPFKGVLDLLANRCLASGTNAWTDTDHTCYTMTTAGSEGFLTLMPIYLDHILYPTLTDSAFITEVHHVNGEGEDAGVVYCEMQGCENTGENRTHLTMLREIYPGKCGYKSETGGRMENLRKSTTNEKVRSYHKTFYRPENLCLVITGQIEATKVFESLKPFENKILSKGKLPDHVRPWQSSVPKLPSTVEKLHPYPSDDEEHGMVYIAWRGPKANEQLRFSAVLILLEYLTDTSISPLQRDFVEREDPYCSKVRYSIIENSEGCIYLKFENVPTAKIKEIKPRLMETLEGLVNRSEPINEQRMSDVIQKRILESLSQLEEDPHDKFAFVAIGDFLYGNTKDELEERVNQVDNFKKLKKEPVSFWTSLLQTYFVGTKCVAVLAEPSTGLMEELAAVEKERVKGQQEHLGEAGLKEREEELKKATEENEVEPPEEMITSVSVPNVECIKFHPITTANSRTAPGAIKQFPLGNMPVHFQLDHVNSNFVMFYALLNSSALPSELQPYIPLFTEAIFESPIMRDGALVPYEQVVAQLAADTVKNGSTVGVTGSRFMCGDFAQVVTIKLKVEMEKYAKGVQWLRDLLFNSQFTAARLKIIATKMANDVARMKRKGRLLVKSLIKDVNYSPGSNHYVANMMRQHSFLTSLQERLEKDPKEVENDMNKVRDYLTATDNLCIHLATNVEKLAKHGKPQQPWLEFLPSEAAPKKQLSAVVHSHQLLASQNASPSQHAIVGVGAIESSYFLQTVPCLSSYTHDDLPAIMVFIQYLVQLEGPMWRQIRGLGLAYGYFMYVSPEQGLLFFTLSDCTHAVDAYKQAHTIVDGYISGKTPFSEVELETSKSSLIFEIIEKETTIGDTVQQSLQSYYKGVGTDYNRDLLKKVSAVTLDDLKRVGPKYFTPLFDPAQCRSVVVAHPSKVEEIVNNFKDFGCQYTALESLENSFLTKL